jgi:hypothetical protein
MVKLDRIVYRAGSDCRQLEQEGEMMRLKGYPSTGVPS